MRIFRLTAIVVVMISSMGSHNGALAESERKMPEGFKFVGAYMLEKRVKIREGQAFPVAIKAIRYEVFTDGITVRCYSQKGSAFTSFEIYRRDGISVARSKGLVERMPGIQAKSTTGDVLRQVSLTSESMTLSRFPALSDIIEITYSRRVSEKVQQ